jgi:hypothetical protein
MVPFIILAERRRRMKGVLMGAVVALGVSELGLYFSVGSMTGMLATLVLFFVAFNLLEASLPSLVAKMAPAAAKGTAMGFFTSSQFIGAFAGGLLGGWFHQSAGVEGVFLLGAGTSLLWFLVVLGLSDPTYLSNRLLRVGVLTEEEAAYMASRLSAVPGVAEAVVVAQDGVAYLKVDRSTLDESELARLSVVSA